MSAASRVGTRLTPAVFVGTTPHDPATAGHLGQCEFVGETDAGMLRVLLKVTDKGEYDWVECGSCKVGWQVPHYAESVG